MYTTDEKNQALKLYDQTKSVTKTIRTLGYPTSQALYQWIKTRNHPSKERPPRKKLNNTPEKPLHPSVKVKLEALHRCFELGENVKLVSEEIGCTRSSIYTWRRKYLLKGAVALMNPNDDPRGQLPEGVPASSSEIDALKAQIQNLQMEIDLLKETLDILKKDPGVDMTTLKNHEKAVIVFGNTKIQHLAIRNTITNTNKTTSLTS